MPLSIEEIRQRLVTVDADSIENPYPPGIIDKPIRPASVLMPLLLDNNVWNLLFIRRTANQYDPHSGQVAFPGGAFDPSDSDEIETALRETEEEVGINPKHVTILGRLKRFITITSYVVSPIVCWIPWPYELNLATDEVSRAFTIPLTWLANSQNQQTQLRKMPVTGLSIPVTYFQPFDGEILWGASARFTLELIKVLYDKKPRIN